MDKMTETEIQTAGRIVMEIARRNGYDEGSYMLKDKMISHRNTSPDDIHAFEKATGFPWEYPTDVSVVFFAVLLALYIVDTVLMNKKKVQ